MIDLYSGTPGSGKSLHAAQRIYTALTIQRRPVVCNFDINLDAIKRLRGTFCYVDNTALTPDYLIKYSQDYFGDKRVVEDQILLVIDECQLLFNAREWGKKGRDKWLSFFTQHRKLGYHVILIAQFDGMIDKQIRALIEYEYVHRKLSNFGWRGLFLSVFFGPGSIIAVKVWYPLNMKVDQEVLHIRKRYYRLYQTYNLFQADQDGGKEKSGARP